MTFEITYEQIEGSNQNVLTWYIFKPFRRAYLNIKSVHENFEIMHIK